MSRPTSVSELAVRLAAVACIAAAPGCESRPEPTSRMVAPSASASAQRAAAPGVAPRISPPPPAAASFDDSACRPAPVSARCDQGYCQIPAGCFVVGSPEDEPGHAVIQEVRTIVTLTRPFAMKATEVTRGEWMAQGLPDPSKRLPDGTGNCVDDVSCPVGNVTWFEAAAFANLLSERHVPPLPACYVLEGCKGKPGSGMTCERAKSAAATLYACEGFRLPTDAEWEYAARAGSRTAFHSGAMQPAGELSACAKDPNLDAIAHYCDGSGGHTHPVGTLRPNAFGLFDVSGNVSEWVNDRDTGAPPSPVVDPGALLEPGEGVTHPGRIRRGGNYRSWPVLCRSAWHHVASWNDRAPGIGFRLARTLPLQ